MQFVFLHLGHNDLEPILLVKSILKTNPQSRIFQISDHNTNRIDGVDELYRLDISPTNIMEFKVLGFSKIDVKKPTWFLDTDMLVVEKLPTFPRNAFLKRNFDLNVEFNPFFRGLNFQEHEYKTMGEVYPFLSCATYALNLNPFTDMIKIFKSLEFKYFRWFGDQEALRIYLSSNDIKFKILLEREYACLPEFFKRRRTKIIHFKGKDKSRMAVFANKYLELI